MMYATATNPDRTKIFDLAKERAADLNDREVTIDHVKNLSGIDDPVHLANQLDASLMYHTTGDSQKIVTHVDDSNGTEAWWGAHSTMGPCERTVWTVAHDANIFATAGGEAQRTASERSRTGKRWCETRTGGRTRQLSPIQPTWPSSCPTSSQQQPCVQKQRGDEDGNVVHDDPNRHRRLSRGR